LGQLDLWTAHLPPTGAYGDVPVVLDRLTDDLYGGRDTSDRRAGDPPVPGRSRWPLLAAVLAGALALVLAIGAGVLTRDGDVSGAGGGGGAGAPANGLGTADFLTLADARAEQQGYLAVVQQQVDAALVGTRVDEAQTSWRTTGDAEVEEPELCEIYGPGLTAWQINRESQGAITGAAARTVLDAVTAQVPTDPRVEVRTVRTAYASDVAISWPAGLGGTTGPGELPRVQSATEVRLGWVPEGTAALDADPASVPGTLTLSARSACARG
jgi:hypothetical protein